MLSEYIKDINIKIMLKILSRIIRFKDVISDYIIDDIKNYHQE